MFSFNSICSVFSFCFLFMGLLSFKPASAAVCAIEPDVQEFQLKGSDDPASEQDKRDRIRQKSTTLPSGIKVIESRGGCAHLAVAFRFREKRFSPWPRDPVLLAKKALILLQEISKEGVTPQTAVLTKALRSWLKQEGGAKTAPHKPLKKKRAGETWSIPCSAESCLMDVSRPRELRLSLTD
jgi:hypothetical protein